jgi:hypothetical protein
MKATCRDLREQVPIRVRVAFALAVAERVLPALSKNTDGFKAARKAVTDCWRWEEGEAIRALQLYENDDEALVLQGSLIVDGEAGAAISAVTSAFYFTLWHSFKQDLEKGLVRVGEVPMMTEVTEEVLDEVCKSATQTSLCDDDWIASVVAKLLRDFDSDNPDELGPTISRDYFAA